jgi:hypothetical protein
MTVKCNLSNYFAAKIKKKSLPIFVCRQRTLQAPAKAARKFLSKIRLQSIFHIVKSFSHENYASGTNIPVPLSFMEDEYRPGNLQLSTEEYLYRIFL